MTSVAAAIPATPARLWAVRARQTLAVVRLELSRSLGIVRSLWLFVIALAPAVVIGAHALHDRGCQLPNETYVLGGILQIYHLRFAVFLGGLGIFMRLVRGEVAERTLHYLFLTPVRREVLVVGKFVAGVITTMLIFGLAITVCFALMYGHFPQGRAFLADGPGLRHLAAYLGVTALACVGYGAVFLALSVIFRNPVIPAMLVFLWEGVNGFLPVTLKHFSVTFYLKPLMPVELPVEWISGLFTVVAEPTPAWAAVTGLLAFAILVLAFACWRIRRMEINYGND